ncbi:hypothetical protein SADUNF_Sadunf10G0161300 [Salix dunnii]|uniref:Uncharacterized protein n=1 Tax=Salix dunnii TaxID=1413687 RepID=A0A835MZ06_9ROSI|nr:hypothetical protein SADUNF_Sadunf10G0161300 [Salix dunnii]
MYFSTFAFTCAYTSASMDGSKKEEGMGTLEPGTQCLRVAGSARFDFHRSDFQWGEPKKVEIASIDRTNSFSLGREQRWNNRSLSVGANRHFGVEPRIWRLAHRS